MGCGKQLGRGKYERRWFAVPFHPKAKERSQWRRRRRVCKQTELRGILKSRQRLFRKQFGAKEAIIVAVAADAAADATQIPD